MNLLFIISGSIAAKKCQFILKELSRKKIYIDCIITSNAQKIIKKNIIKKCINGKIFYDSFKSYILILIFYYDRHRRCVTM